jgi:hypothetical protein
MARAKKPSTMAEIDQQLEDERKQGYCRIGEFVVWFSQLEFTIRARLAAALSLPDRVGIAHGTWTHGTQGIIARQVPRGSLKARYLYENPQALAQLTQKARELMPEVMQLGGTAPKPGTKTFRPVNPSEAPKP